MDKIIFFLSSAQCIITTENIFKEHLISNSEVIISFVAKIRGDKVLHRITARPFLLEPLVSLKDIKDPYSKTINN